MSKRAPVFVHKQMRIICIYIGLFPRLSPLSTWLSTVIHRQTRGKPVFSTISTSLSTIRRTLHKLLCTDHGLIRSWEGHNRSVLSQIARISCANFRYFSGLTACETHNPQRRAGYPRSTCIRFMYKCFKTISCIWILIIHCRQCRLPAAAALIMTNPRPHKFKGRGFCVSIRF